MEKSYIIDDPEGFELTITVITADVVHNFFLHSKILHSKILAIYCFRYEDNGWKRT